MSISNSNQVAVDSVPKPVGESTSKEAQERASVALAAAHAEAASFERLLQYLDYMDAADVERVRAAFKLADEAHLGQKRKTGEPYITHPIAVAIHCTTWRLDAAAIMAALLHDVMEDCGITKENLTEKFGTAVADIVDGLTKLDKLQFATKEEGQAESFRKMLLAMVQDVRVILIKLADRTHNMRTLQEMPKHKQARIAKETLDIYVPLADRLGLNRTFLELQELSYGYLYPWRYNIMRRALERARGRQRFGVDKALEAVQAAFAKYGMKAQVEGREKSLYSIYRKMKYKHLSFAEVLDVFAIRVFVNDTLDCYKALGIVHQTYTPLPGKFKDYVAIPKPNGYQSLHTVVTGPSGIHLEVQIRTDVMHLVAESGVAAHWLYKANSTEPSNTELLGTKWLQSLLDIQRETNDSSEFWDHVKVDLFPNSVYVLTPQGEVVSLPKGATAVDFAYAIHTDVGDAAVGAKVNDQLEPLHTEVKSGDKVEIITQPDSRPNPAWLGFVRTGRARSKIRHSLKLLSTQEATALGQRFLQQSLRAEGYRNLPDVSNEKMQQQVWQPLIKFTANTDLDDLYNDICMGKRFASVVAQRMVLLLKDADVHPDPLLLSQSHFASEDQPHDNSLVLDGSANAFITYAKCCHPIPGERVSGYLGYGEGLQVHTKNCQTAIKLYKNDGERFIPVYWADTEDLVRRFEKPLLIKVRDQRGILAKVTQVIADTGADIVSASTHAAAGDASWAEMRLMISVDNRQHYNSVMKRLKATANVQSVGRRKPKPRGVI